VAGPLGVTVAKPRSKVGDDPGKTTPAAAVIELPPPYGAGATAGGPMVIGPGLFELRKPKPATAHPSPFMSVKPAVAVAVVWSAPAPPAVVLHGLAAGSSAVPYMQSSPGSLVSPILVTSLSPVCGFEVFTTPIPHAFWSTRTQKFSPGRRKVGTLKPGWSQHVVVLHPEFGSAQPGMPAHAASG